MQVHLPSFALCDSCVGFKTAYFYVLLIQSVLTFSAEKFKRMGPCLSCQLYITSVPDSAWNISVDKFLVSVSDFKNANLWI